MGTIAQMGNQPFAKIVVMYNGEKKEVGTHIVLTLDCSGSMWDSIGKLREDAKRFVNGQKTGTFVTIIVYSGHNQARAVIEATDCDDAGKRALCSAIDRNVEVMGITVFSEALEKSILAVETAKGALNHTVVLFTDGCPVPGRWSEQEEIGMAITEARTMRGKGIGLSCLGYGSYYNGDFLAKLMAASGNNGVMEHMDAVGGKFGEIVAKILDITKRTHFGKFEMEIKGGGRAFKVTPQASAVGMSGKISFNGMLDGQTTIFVEMQPGGTSLNISGSFNGQSVSTTIQTETANVEVMTEFMVGKAAVAMNDGRNSEAAELFAEAGMEELSYRAKSSNSPTEKRRLANNLRYFYTNRNWIGAGLKNSGPNHCGINAMRLIAEGCEQGEVVIRVDRYKRTGIKKVKEGVISGNGNPVLVTKVTSHDYRANFGFTTADEGAKIATNEGFKKFTDYKTFLVIADGEYHDAQFSASFTKESWFTKLQESGVIGKDLKFKVGEFYVLVFDQNLPLVSPNFARPSALGLVPLLMEEAELEAKQRALNARIKKLRLTEATSYEAPPKQAEDENLPVDQYETSCCEYKLMKYKTPAAPTSYDSLDYDQALEERGKVKRRLNQVRFMYRSIRFACEVTGSEVISWGPGKTRAGSVKTAQQTIFDGQLLQRDRWTEMVEFS